jgi:hypothetical protein
MRHRSFLFTEGRPLQTSDPGSRVKHGPAVRLARKAVRAPASRGNVEASYRDGRSSATHRGLPKTIEGRRPEA